MTIERDVASGPGAAGAAPKPRVAGRGPDPRTVRAALAAWYRAHRRDLPWRRSGDPYAIWISEVMLQQTRVQTVLPYYRRWMERFPDVATLADACLEDVLGVWKGLGYYARARRVHAAARVVRDAHGGSLPRTYDALRALPGVGDYTAGAVASIAFGAARPAVDGNVRRVFARLYDEPRPTGAWMRARAQELLDRDRPGDFNQALMELGALACTPRAPACDACPLTHMCAARASGSVLERPVQNKRSAPRQLALGVLVARAGSGRTLVVRRPVNGLLGGLWEFPSVRLEQDGDAAEAVGERARLAGRPAGPGDGGATGPAPTPLPVVRHRFTHLLATYHPFMVSVAREWEEPRGRWVHPDELDRLALSAAQIRIARSAWGDGA